MKAKKRTYITDILIVLLVIVLSLFILDGKKFYTIPNDNILDYNEDLLYQSMPTAKKWTCYPMKTLIIHRFIFTK